MRWFSQTHSHCLCPLRFFSELVNVHMVAVGYADSYQHGCEVMEWTPETGTISYPAGRVFRRYPLQFRTLLATFPSSPRWSSWFSATTRTLKHQDDAKLRETVAPLFRGPAV